MSTIIYPSPIFGPVRSRRLGLSLGINLMPADGKICTFNCVYCECGLNEERRPKLPRPTREAVAEALERKLTEMKAQGQRPDVLTFAGNGEPTLHPKFPEIIADTIRLRNQFCPDAKVSVLSNATRVYINKVREALLLVDNNIQKLDTVSPEYIRLVDQPTQASFNVAEIVDQLCQFQGHVIVQTLFLRGTVGGVSVDNTGQEFVQPWLAALQKIKPQQVMIYTIDRETPLSTLLKATPAQLDSIALQVESAGIGCSVSY